MSLSTYTHTKTHRETLKLKPKSYLFVQQLVLKLYFIDCRQFLPFSLFCISDRHIIYLFQFSTLLVFLYMGKVLCYVVSHVCMCNDMVSNNCLPFTIVDFFFCSDLSKTTTFGLGLQKLSIGQPFLNLSQTMRYSAGLVAFSALREEKMAKKTKNDDEKYSNN